MGADAIILCPQPGGPEQTGAVRPAKVEAVAIKYRLGKSRRRMTSASIGPSSFRKPTLQ